MGSNLISLALVLGILVSSALITRWFARAMYIVCPKCGTLNARRRTLCRACGQNLRNSNE